MKERRTHSYTFLEVNTSFGEPHNPLQRQIRLAKVVNNDGDDLTSVGVANHTVFSCRNNVLEAPGVETMDRTPVKTGVWLRAVCEERSP